MSNAACNAVTYAVTYGISNDVRTHVQNQNQNQSLITAVCGVFGEGFHPSNGELGRPAQPHQPAVPGAWMAADAARIGR